ncbi:MAG: DUF2125 domain-containing protein [Devosiaceae bacterium]|nr:DUF2125 domain-containing protein [Devosiaceae bacterium]
MKKFLFLMIFIIVIVAGWSAAWVYAAQRIDAEANSLFASTANTTQQLNCEQFNVLGFPFRFDITCTNLSINSLDSSLNIPEITVTVLVYRPTHALIFAEGPAVMENIFSGSKRQVSWNSLRASVRTNGWSLARVSVEGENIELVDTIVGQTLIASSSQINMHLIDDPDIYDEDKKLQSFGIFATLSDIEVPEIAIASASIQAQATVSAMPDDLRLWTLANISSNWFENQTGIDVLEFEGSDESSSFSILGNLTTTAQAMPNGDFDFTSKNLNTRFKSFLDETGQDVAFGQLNEDGTRYQSYAVRHGVVLAGNLPLLTLAPLR